MYTVREGDLVVFRIRNKSGDVHPMHLHGHHALVLSRDGKPASGSPWWVDSLNVRDGETYEIAFRADNPGVWMDHCHNLPHAAEGLVAHLMYAGYETPFSIGGRDDNDPE
jgi:FtsP/CotA-like multicopper oxidase with cupredoxin domain